MLTHCQQEKRERDREGESALAALLRVEKKTLLDVEPAQHKQLANYFWNGRGVFEMWECFPGYIPQTANKWQAHKQDVRVMTFSPCFSLHTHTHTMDRIVFLISKLLTQKSLFSKSFPLECVLKPQCVFRYVCLCEHTNSIHLEQQFKGWLVYHKPVLFDIWLNSITANQQSKMLSVGSHRLWILSLTVDRLHIISPNKKRLQVRICSMSTINWLNMI